MGYFYEGYYDFILMGRYGHEIRRMHEKYGPIVRINPDELHCSDPRFVDEIYAGGNRKRDKWQHSMNTGATGPIVVGGFSTIPHELHRMRRLPMNKFFSRAQMLKLEGEVDDFTQRTCDKLLRTKGPFDLKEAFNCYTADIISQYSFGEPMGFIDQEGWEPNFGGWVKSFFNSAYMMRHVAPARAAVTVAPFFANYMGDDMKNLMYQLQVVIPGHIQKALDNKDNGRIFADLIENKQLPDSEKSIYRLSGEGFNLLVAGTETTAATLACISYYLLAQPATYARLLEDLQGADPLNLRWTDLEQRPYLWAVIHEALRLTPGVSQRSARIAREEDLVYTSEDGETNWVIPRGTPVGMTSIIQHSNEELFPSPKEFIAERWLLENGQRNYALEKHLISFSKGSRTCLAKDLAYCELYLMTAAMALRVLGRTRLHEMTIEDVQYDHDQIVPQTKKGSY
ncbi:Trichodiene oxygenase [Cytospora mali]|uniref:Trichodiene oxygenase n=1 Tax=Cytospora mali TaxID=578113 RepID=A0A194VUT9_CYTMA|nr:Trichodiene oxygenase [Valsa mali]